MAFAIEFRHFSFATRSCKMFTYWGCGRDIQKQICECGLCIARCRGHPSWCDSRRYGKYGSCSPAGLATEGFSSCCKLLCCLGMLVMVGAAAATAAATVAVRGVVQVHYNNHCSSSRRAVLD